MSHRKTSIKLLSNYIKDDKTVKDIENDIYSETGDNKVILYKEYIYQIIGDILKNKNISDIQSNIKQNKIGWSHDSFNQLRIRMEEQDNFIENPFEVAEGVQQCKTINKNTGKICNSRRVMYYQIQERGADEPMTTYNECCACGAKWKYAG